MGMTPPAIDFGPLVAACQAVADQLLAAFRRAIASAQPFFDVIAIFAEQAYPSRRVLRFRERIVRKWRRTRKRSR